MTFTQSKKAVLNLLRKTPLLRGFKSTEFDPGYIYCPHIPLMITTTVTQDQLEHMAETRRQLAESERRVEAHIVASRNVDPEI